MNIKLIAPFALTLLATPARATWSIFAVDRETGQVGIAGASCTYNVAGIGECVPGQGIVVVQAMSNGAARNHGVALLKQGKSPAEIVAAMRADQFDPEQQQYGVVVIADDGQPAFYHGEKIAAWNGAAVGDGVLALGNILVDEKVVTSALAAFEAAKQDEQSLAECLMAALAAGAEAGGDKRCGEQAATSAFVTVFNYDDTLAAPYLHINAYGIEKGGAPAVAEVAKEFERWRKHAQERRSTRIYLVP